MSKISKAIHYFIFGDVEAQKRRKAENYKQSIIQTANLLVDSGITCRCNGLAIPTSCRGKIYRCLECKKQFANAFYNLEHIGDKYEEAVAELTNKNK